MTVEEARRVAALELAVEAKGKHKAPTPTEHVSSILVLAEGFNKWLAGGTVRAAVSEVRAHWRRPGPEDRATEPTDGEIRSVLFGPPDHLAPLVTQAHEMFAERQRLTVARFGVAERIVRSVADVDGWFTDPRSPRTTRVCMFCNAQRDHGHTGDCPIVLAQALVAELDVDAVEESR